MNKDRSDQNVILETISLSKHFQKLFVLDRINLLIMEKEINFLIGPHGAGKTTSYKVVY